MTNLFIYLHNMIVSPYEREVYTKIIGELFKYEANAILYGASNTKYLKLMKHLYATYPEYLVAGTVNYFYSCLNKQNR